jgi:methyl-accepting chemotaxis protein
MVASMDEIAGVAVANAAAVHEVALSAGGQYEAMAETVASAQAMSDLADELRGALQRFQIKGTS